MATPDREVVLQVLRDAANFTRRAGAKSEAHELDQYCTQFESVKPTFKLLRSEVQAVMDNAYRAFESVLYDEYRKVRPGNEALEREFSRIWIAWRDDATYPARVIETKMETTGFAGSEGVQEKTVQVMGDPAGAGPIFEQAVATVNHFCYVICHQDYETAYELLASETKAWMSFKRFLSTLDHADSEFGGKPVDYLVERMGICADEAARKLSNRDGGWPKDTPKQNKRAGAGVFWIKKPGTKEGCWGALWITEENGGYRIAKFSHFLQ